MKKSLFPVLLLLAGLSGCVMYGRGGGPTGQPYVYGSGALPPQNNAPQPQQPYGGAGLPGQ